MLQIQTLSPERFRPYGELICFNEQNMDQFQVVLTEEILTGWRIAVKKVTEREIIFLGKHPDSRESFEPLSGIALICVAPQESPEDMEVFLLDRPVCLHKNVWHTLISLSEVATVKITENNVVSSDGYKMKEKMGLAVVEF
ncbi:MAG TPA: ureidoglycolate lyase [Bacillota bacterium]|nr:ureidoglycolate lyase [Bacillota bacterium]